MIVIVGFLEHVACTGEEKSEKDIEARLFGQCRAAQADRRDRGFGSCKNM